jgi:hypothetical protein
MAQDDAGNVGYSLNKGFNFLSIFDQSGPDILIDSPTPGAVYNLRQAVPARYACSDPAGVQSCVGTVPNGQNVDTSSVGPKTFTVTSTDLGGRQTTKTVSYFVRYGFTGFLDPINNPPKINNANPGDKVQLEWQLRDGTGGYIRDLSTVVSVYDRAVDCTARPLTEGDGPTIPPGDSLQYVPHREQFRYTWHISRDLPTRTCRRLVIVLDDGTKHFADFRLR